MNRVRLAQKFQIISMYPIVLHSLLKRESGWILYVCVREWKYSKEQGQEIFDFRFFHKTSYPAPALQEFLKGCL
jgi:hypothetical protein